MERPTANIILQEKSCLFRSESEVQKEEKGGYLSFKSSIKGLDRSSEQVEKIEVYLESDHDTKIHSNLLRISKKHCLAKNARSKNNNERGTMQASAYKVTLKRDENNDMVVDVTDHLSYLSCGLKKLSCWNEGRQELTFGGSEGLCTNSIKPLSKQERGDKEKLHIRDLLEYRKGELKDKRSDNDLENFFSKTQNIHKAKIKIVYYVSSITEANGEHNNNTKEMMKVEKRSDWVFASNLYTLEIDQWRTNLKILDSSSIWLLTIMLSRCEATLALNFNAEFVFRYNVENKHGKEESVSEREIEIMRIPRSRTNKKLPETSVTRIGNSKTHTLQVFIRTNNGNIMNMAKRNEGKIFLKIHMKDESGAGLCDDMEVGIIEHDCQFDKSLAYYDTMFEEILKAEKIQEKLLASKITNTPCSICKLQGTHARTQFHEETKDDVKVKRKPSTYTDSQAIDIKRPKGKFVFSCMFTRYKIKCNITHYQNCIF